jgi:site-specific DNA recombinase
MGQGKRQRSAIYVRISRDQAGTGLGTERQETLCRDLAVQLGVEVAEVYSDNDVSAYSGRRRPGYERMLADIEAGRVDLVLCYHSDRLMRRTKDLERYIDVCRPRAVVTHQVTAGVLDLSTATGLAVAKTVAAWNQHESDHKAERIKAQKKQAAAAGKYLGGRVPWGWTKVDTITDRLGRKRGGRVVVDEVAAGLIRSGAEAIVAGRSLMSVTRDWADSGAVSLSGLRMNTTQVRRVLMRPRNAGLMTFHGQVVGDDWPAVVPLSLFRKVEAVLTSPDRPRQSESKFRYLLSGIAVCYCGRRMTGFGVEKGRRSYRCSVHQEGGRYVAGHANRAMRPLDEYVQVMAGAYLARDDVRAVLVAELQAQENRSRPVESADVVALLNRKKQLARLFAQGQISEEQLTEGTLEIAAMLNALESMAAANGGSRAVSGVLLSDDPRAEFLSSPVDIQREILRDLFTIELRESGPHRGEFDPSTVRMVPRDVSA